MNDAQRRKKLQQQHDKRMERIVLDIEAAERVAKNEAEQQANVDLGVELAQWKGKARAAEAKLALVDEYGSSQWAAGMVDGSVQSFAEWLAERQQPEPQSGSVS